MSDKQKKKKSCHVCPLTACVLIKKAPEATNRGLEKFLPILKHFITEERTKTKKNKPKQNKNMQGHVAGRDVRLILVWPLPFISEEKKAVCLIITGLLRAVTF